MLCLITIFLEEENSNNINFVGIAWKVELGKKKKKGTKIETTLNVQKKFHISLMFFKKVL